MNKADLIRFFIWNYKFEFVPYKACRFILCFTD